jgi:hypothetical protein
VNKFFNAYDFEKQILFPCSYSSPKEINDMQSDGISTPNFFLFKSETNKFGSYEYEPLNKFCNKNFYDVRNSQILKMFNVAMMKSQILNQLCCLEEIIVLPSIKLFAGSQKARKFHQGEISEVNLMFQAHLNKFHNPYTSCYHCEHIDMDCKGRNEEVKMISHGNYCICPPSAFYRLISGQQKVEDDFSSREGG